MIDLHCHILPGLDDGPATLDEALAMCRIAAQDGISTIVATPHFRPGTFQHASKRIAEAVVRMNAVNEAQGIPMQILPGADVTITPELGRYLAEFDHLTINMTGRYFLAEFSSDAVPSRWDDFLLSFFEQNRIPIITHPERNRWFLGHRDALYPFVQRGGMLQITAMSLTGHAGIEARDFCAFLLRHDLAAVIASDAHNTADRPPVLSPGLAVAAGLVGAQKADAMVKEIPAAILRGDRPALPEPRYAVTPRTGKNWLRKLASW